MLCSRLLDRLETRAQSTRAAEQVGGGLPGEEEPLPAGPQQKARKDQRDAHGQQFQQKAFRFRVNPLEPDGGIGGASQIVEGGEQNVQQQPDRVQAEGRQDQNADQDQSDYNRIFEKRPVFPEPGVF